MSTLPDCMAPDGAEPCKGYLELQAAIKRLKAQINFRLNEYLCEMEPGYDDSIVGFNEAWKLVQEIFDEIQQ